MLSIIIPTLNEEKYLPRLLDSIKKQDFFDYEIIVSDAGSIDKTLEIALNYKCRVIKGGLPAKGKNQGAKAAKGDLLLFLDADTILPEDFLKINLKEFKRRKLQIAGFLISSFEKNRKITNWLFNLFYNFPIIFWEKIIPHAAIAILISKDVFEKINGFDENIILAEDHDLTRRAAKFGRYGILKKCKVLTSERRFRKDGWIKTYLKYIYTELHMIFIGPIKKQGIIKYEFNHYSDKNKK